MPTNCLFLNFPLLVLYNFQHISYFVDHASITWCVLNSHNLLQLSKTKTFNALLMIGLSANAALYKFDIYCFVTHDISAVFLPLLKATSSGDSIELNALIVALTTLTGFVDP